MHQLTHCELEAWQGRRGVVQGGGESTCHPQHHILGRFDPVKAHVALDLLCRRAEGSWNKSKKWCPAHIREGHLAHFAHLARVAHTRKVKEYVLCTRQSHPRERVELSERRLFQGRSQRFHDVIGFGDPKHQVHEGDVQSQHKPQKKDRQILHP